jgi:tetratricopeptide (TPR) repeat protein
VEATQKLPENPPTSPDSQALFVPLGGHMAGLAELLAHTGEFPEVVEISEQLIEVSEKLANLSRYGFESLGHACRWLSNTPGHEKEFLRKGVAAFERCLQQDPTRESHRSFLADTLNGLGERLMGRKEMGDAESCFRKARGLYETLLEKSPNNREYRAGITRSYANLIKVLRAQDKQADAEETLRSIAEKLDDDVQNRIFRGTLHRDLGEIDKAIADFSWAIAKDPKLAEVWDLRGNCYFRKGEFAKAVEDYSHAIKLKPGEGWYWHERAFAYLMLGQHEKAIADHSASIEISDQDAGQRLRRGHSYRALGELDKAEADYNRAVELNPSYWENWYSRGRAYAERGQPDKAQADFAKASELCPKDAGSLNNLAWKLATSADPNERNVSMAVALAKKGIEVDPNSVLLPNTLGVAHYRAGNWNDAVEWLKKSMDVRKGGDSFDWFFLVMTHWQLGNKDEARKWYDQAIDWMDKNAPTNEELKRFRAEAAELLGVNEQQEK